MGERKKLLICPHCLMAIESHEGRQTVMTVSIDDEDEVPCDWCHETIEDGYAFII
jgi:hypothetical protein